MVINLVGGYLMKNIIKIVFIVLATIIGAGFASGKEIYSFFFVYGKNGILGIFISSFIIGLTTYKVLKLCYVFNLNTFHDFCAFILKQNFPKHDSITTNKISDFISNIVNILLLISFYIMISGFSCFLNQEFHLNKIIGSLIILLLCYIAFKKNINSLIQISNYLVPVLIFLLIFISCKNLNFNENYNRIMSHFNENSIFQFCINAILYGCYNCILLIPVLIKLQGFIKNVTTVYVASIITFLVIVLLNMCVFNILLLGDIKTYSLEMPLIEILKRYNTFLRVLYLFMIGSSIYTTALSTGCAFLNGCNFRNYKRNSILICFTAVFLSQISFSIFVQLLYPILGTIGLLVFLGSLTKNITN